MYLHASIPPTRESDYAGEGSIKIVTELLGHANPSITVNYYIHTSKQRIAKVCRGAAPLAGGVVLLGAGKQVECRLGYYVLTYAIFLKGFLQVFGKPLLTILQKLPCSFD